MFSSESPPYRFQYKKDKSPLIILNLPQWDFFQRLEKEFETTMVDHDVVSFEQPGPGLKELAPYL